MIIARGAFPTEGGREILPPKNIYPASFSFCKLFVKKSGSISTVRVTVIKGMLTPVRVNIKNLFEEEIAGRIVKFFEINVIPEKPIPFTPRPPENVAKKKIAI